MNEENDYDSEFLSSLMPNKKQQKKIDALMQIAAKIQDGLKAKGWNKSMFAEEMGVTSLSIITKWLSGTNNFQSDTLLEIQNVLGIKLLDLERNLTSSFRGTSGAGEFIKFDPDELYGALDERTGSCIKNVLEYKNMQNNSTTTIKV